jgi:peptidyl-prolyl cis-trans isomerase A (cyclophilin A)
MAVSYAKIAAGVACLMWIGCSSPTVTKKEETKQAEAKKEVPKNEPAPDTYKVKFETGKGDVVIQVTRAWAPIGADHFYTLVKTGFYDGARFFRVRPGFVVQFGVNGDPKTNRLWSTANLPDDPVKQTNAKGTVTYATAGPNTRTTQIFINLTNNKRLDKDGFAPFGKVVEGMDAVASFYSGYGEIAPAGQGPDTDKLEQIGNEYLLSKFPRLDFIKKAAVLP